jgi:hypothetical protein
MFQDFFIFKTDYVIADKVSLKRQEMLARTWLTKNTISVRKIRKHLREIIDIERPLS